MGRDERILILSTDAREYALLLRQRGLDALIVAAVERPEDLPAEAETANIVLGDPDRVAAVLGRLAGLDWIQSTWAGIKPLLEAEAQTEHRLTGVKGVFGPAVSEYVFCFALMHARRLLGAQRARAWSPTAVARLQGQTMAILGVGSIGAHVARTAKHFGMRTIGFSRASRACPDIDEYRRIDDLANVIAEVDYLVGVLPDTPHTTHLLNREVFAAMKSTALLINTGRANVIDDDALLEALGRGCPAAAVLDVFRQEPLPPAHPFWSTPNLFITAHTAAVTRPTDVVPIFVDNLERLRRGKPLNYLIDPDRGY